MPRRRKQPVPPGVWPDHRPIHDGSLSAQPRLRATDRAAIPARRYGQRLTARTRHPSGVPGWLCPLRNRVVGESNLNKLRMSSAFVGADRLIIIRCGGIKARLLCRAPHSKTSGLNRWIDGGPLLVVFGPAQGPALDRNQASKEPVAARHPLRYVAACYENLRPFGFIFREWVYSAPENPVSGFPLVIPDILWFIRTCSSSGNISASAGSLCSRAGLSLCACDAASAGIFPPEIFPAGMERRERGTGLAQRWEGCVAFSSLVVSSMHGAGIK